MLKAVEQKQNEISKKSAQILKEQAEERRQLTEDETKETAQYVKDMKTLEEQEADYRAAVQWSRRFCGSGCIGMTTRQPDRTPTAPPPVHRHELGSQPGVASDLRQA